MESQAPQLIRNAGKKAKEKKWYVLAAMVILAGAIALAIDYYGKSEEESAVLMLSTLKSTNVPYVISLKGESSLK